MHENRSGVPRNDEMTRWLLSGRTCRICGLDLRPIPHPVLGQAPTCIIHGQAAVYFLEQLPHGGRWLLKKFAPSRRPLRAYLEAVGRCLPGGLELFTCTQRRLLTAAHYDRIYSQHKDIDLVAWLEGTILMPKVPGSPWLTIADALRQGELVMPLPQRIKAALNLAECIERLEAAGVSHRDISATNVFVTAGGWVYLIDLDCLYHSSLPFPGNTTAGTNGYMAHFLRGPDGQWDASRSWCPHADRFALAILIAEFLLVGPGGPTPQEDGSLFSQAQLAEPDGSFVKQQTEALVRVDRDCGVLLWRALHASGFDACPQPTHWKAALRRALRATGSNTSASRGQMARRTCPNCNTEFLIREAVAIQLLGRGIAILCHSCLIAQQQSRSHARLELDLARPRVLCEHCGELVRIPRDKLAMLRSSGKPMLCRSCLQDQLRAWKSEQEQRDHLYPMTQCSRCSVGFRLPRHKIELLETMGKAVLCRRCLGLELQARGLPRWSIP